MWTLRLEISRVCTSVYNSLTLLRTLGSSFITSIQVKVEHARLHINLSFFIATYLWTWNVHFSSPATQNLQAPRLLIRPQWQPTAITLGLLTFSSFVVSSSLLTWASSVEIFSLLHPPHSTNRLRITLTGKFFLPSFSTFFTVHLPFR